MPIDATIGSRQEFLDFLGGIDTQEFRQSIADKIGLPLAEVIRVLNIYMAEMAFGYDFVAERLPAGKLRILEVGAGLGLLSVYLARCGHEVTAL